MRFILHTEGSEGTAAPIVAVASALKRRRHDVRLVMPSGLAQRYSGSNLEIDSVGSVNSYQASIRDGEMLNNPRTVPYYFRAHFFPCVVPTIRTIEHHIRDLGRCLLVGLDTPGLAARLAAERCSLPHVSLMAFPAQISTVRAYVEMLDTVLRRDITELRNCLGLSAATTADWWGKTSRRLAFWPKWFSEGLTEDHRDLYCGFILDEADRGMIETCNVQQRTSIDVLITGGTSKFAGSSFFSESIEACQSLRLKTAVVCAHGDLLPDFNANFVTHYDRVDPLTSIMRTARVVVHHGGMGTIGVAFANGVPQVVLAKGGDRPENGRFVQACGAGVNLPRVGEGWNGVRAGIETVLGSALIPNTCERYRTTMEQLDSVDLACDALEAVAKASQ
jgi:rhamnosyltransferase subunit B